MQSPFINFKLCLSDTKPCFHLHNNFQRILGRETSAFVVLKTLTETPL